MKTSTIGQVFKDQLKMKYSPVGFYYTDKKPDDAAGFKNGRSGCIMPLILSSAKGKTLAFDKKNSGWPCSAFHLGFTDWIFPGIEYFLSNGPMPGRECERFVKTPELARQYVKSLKPEVKNKGFAVFKPLEKFEVSEEPELVIFFANPDQLSALVYLLYFDAPGDDDRVVTRFASACGSAVTLPLRYSRNSEKKAVWGFHDISARAKLPKELMTFSLPFNLLKAMSKELNDSFIKTGRWEKLTRRF